MQCRNLRDTREEVVDPQRFWYGHHQFWISIPLNSCHCLKLLLLSALNTIYQRKKLSMPERSASLTGWGSHDGTMCHNLCQPLPSVFAIFFSYISENPTTKLKKLWLLKGFTRKLIQKECFWDLIYFTRSFQRDVCGIAVAIITKRMRNSHNGEEVRHKSIAQQRQVSICCAMAQSMVWTRCWTWWDIKMWDKKEDVFFVFFFVLIVSFA